MAQLNHVFQTNMGVGNLIRCPTMCNCEACNSMETAEREPGYRNQDVCWLCYFRSPIRISANRRVGQYLRVCTIEFSGARSGQEIEAGSRPLWSPESAQFGPLVDRDVGQNRPPPSPPIDVRVLDSPLRCGWGVSAVPRSPFDLIGEDSTPDSW
jgi:hypothetical protein